MDTNENRNLLFKQEVFQIVGCAFEVLNHLGHGLHEKPYENALVVEFGLQAFRFGNNRPMMSSSDSCLLVLIRGLFLLRCFLSNLIFLEPVGDKAAGD